MSTQFSAHMISLLDDVVLLNRAVYGGPDALRTKFLDDYDAARDPDNVGNRDALFVYDRYDAYLKTFDFKTLSSAELGFDSSVVGADEASDGLDHNYTYAGDLFRNNYLTTDAGEVAFTGAGAVALVSLKETEKGNTLHLTFRGTDADGPLADGEAGTANGQMRYYQQLTALIEQVHDYVSDSSNDVSEIVVSGHSLGGTVADMFALYDGARFDDIGGVKLSVVALASAGIAPELLTQMPDYDKSMVNIGVGGLVTFNTPDWYFQYDQANDIVRNPDQYDFAAHTAADPTQAPITALAVSLLEDHIHFEDNRVQFETSMIDQYAVSKNLETNFLVNHYADFYEMIGTEFSKAWTEVGDMTFDHFIALFGTNDQLDGTPGTNNVNGWGVSVDDSAEYRNRSGDLFLLGFSGEDVIRTGKGADFISGGAGDDRIYASARGDLILGDIRGEKGNDVIFAGRGADQLFGGMGADDLKGNAGKDILHGGSGADILGGGADSDRFVFKANDGRDTITDFDSEGKDHDRIDLTGLTGIKDWADLRDHHLAQDGTSVILDAGHGDILTLENIKIAELHPDDFLI